MKLVPSLLPVCLEVRTDPALRVTDTAEVELTSTLKDTLTVEDFLDLGTYPMFLAKDTIFSLRVAPSMKTSLVAMLAL